MAEHEHRWVDHCTSSLCPWRQCELCKSIQDMSGHTPGRIIPTAPPPQDPKR